MLGMVVITYGMYAIPAPSAGDNMLFEDGEIMLFEDGEIMQYED